ncbi:hypothetical protein BSKO_02522 [Bryopsis sp. KO-2023]|nr:hypothetical protein BSKO_02522 [Bryopsis sp. KO-2023]
MDGKAGEKKVAFVEKKELFSGEGKKPPFLPFQTTGRVNSNFSKIFHQRNFFFPNLEKLDLVKKNQKNQQQTRGETDQAPRGVFGPGNLQGKEKEVLFKLRCGGGGGEELLVSRDDQVIWCFPEILELKNSRIENHNEGGRLDVRGNEEENLEKIRKKTGGGGGEIISEKIYKNKPLLNASFQRLLGLLFKCESPTLISHYMK